MLKSIIINESNDVVYVKKTNNLVLFEMCKFLNGKYEYQLHCNQHGFTPKVLMDKEIKKGFKPHIISSNDRYYEIIVPNDEELKQQLINNNFITKQPQLFLKAFNLIQRKSYDQNLKNIYKNIQSNKYYDFDNLIYNYKNLLIQEFEKFNYLILDFEELYDLIQTLHSTICKTNNTHPFFEKIKKFNLLEDEVITFYLEKFVLNFKIDKEKCFIKNSKLKFVNDFIRKILAFDYNIFKETKIYFYQDCD